ncbi:MAG: DUF2029 domain-containing protein [Acidobacteriia bacterium]|nr:DUF2029 domain-containing protein [Terriglobia bacterium]
MFTAAALFGHLIAQSMAPSVRGYDFRAMYAAGQIVRSGNGSRLYDLQEQARAEEAIFERPGLLLIVHPPFEALFFAPLTRFSYASAYLIWGAINILLWMLFAYLARSFAPVPQQIFRYLILCFTFFPLWITMISGQTTIPLVVLYCLTYIALKGQQDFRAGVFLGLGLFRFQLVLPFALICLLRQKWRMMAGFAVTAVLLGGLSVVAVGLSGVASYVTLLVNIVRRPADSLYGAFATSDMPTVRGVLSVLMAGRVAPEWVSVTVALVSGLLILFVAGLWRRKDRLERDASLGLMFAAALAVTLITGYHVYYYDLSLLLLAVFLVLGSPQWSRKTPWRAVVYVSIAVLYLPPVYLLLGGWRRLYLLWFPLFIFVLALFGLLRQPPLLELTATSANGAAAASPACGLGEGKA